MQELKNRIISTTDEDWRELTPFQPKGFKKADKRLLDKLKKSYLNNGKINAFTCWQSGGVHYIIDGHTTQTILLQLEEEGYSIPEKLTCNWLDLKDRKEARKVVLLYNSHYAKIDSKSLLDWIPDFSELLGEVELPDIGELLESDINETKEEYEVKESDIEVSKKPPIVSYGDIFEIRTGKLIHRIMCGDSTKKEDIVKLTNSKNCELLFTSPPYSDMRSYEKGKDLSINHLSNFIPSYYDYVNYQVINLGLQFKDTEVVQYWNKYIDKARNAGYKFLGWNVWDKTQGGSIASATNMFMLTHEWLFVFGKERKSLNRTIHNQLEKYEKRHGKYFMNGIISKIRGEDDKINKTHSKAYTHHQIHSVIQETPELGTIRKEHPATMPIKLVSSYIEAMTNEYDIVIDSFLGSGTTLIAGNELSRNVYGMELEPRYIEVIIRRYNNYSKGKDYSIKCLNREIDINSIINNI